MTDYSSAFDAADLEELAEMISKKVNNPITIEDFNHQLIAYSKHGDWTDKARMETIMERRVPEPVLNQLWQDGILQKLMEKDKPIRIEEKTEVGLGKRVAISIRKSHAVLGYIYVQELNQTLGDDEVEFLRHAARAAVPMLHYRQTKRLLEEEKKKGFFWELLLGSSSSHHDIMIRADYLNLSLPKQFAIFVFDFRNTEFELIQKELVFLISNLKDFFSIREFPLWVTNQKQMILLGGESNDQENFNSLCQSFIQELKSQLQERFGSINMTGVYGNPYKSYQYIEHSYRQAMAVLRIRRLLPKETVSIHGYPDLGIYRLLPSLLEKNTEEQFINFRLQQLKKYDKESHNHLMETLEVYLDCVGRVNLASQLLHIHPNTLAYRLKRIQEICGLDLNDPNHWVSTFIDLKLMKLSEEK
ncbi:PucR family transcriptional regulator [Ammoniphilus sp. 3BR4]|uniref:PucR family transcriptional regulator n=1 Tax=Ammoniphilus sp. 3BR4 TaxID=3158265 RepID=UPI003466B223